MSTNTYVALATQTLGSAVSSVTFSSIPQGYTDLVLVGSFNQDSNVNLITVRVGNGSVDTASNYSMTYLLGTGSAASSGRYANQTSGFLTRNLGGTTTVNASNMIAHFQNYSNTTTYKTIINRANQSDSLYPGVEANVNLWRSTSAINVIQLGTTGGNIAAGSTFTIYGIANADTFTKATGGIISEDSTYTYHVFGSSGTFTPKQSLTADILVVGGGGGGCNNTGAGGGAGKVVEYTAQSLTSTGYSITVGAGGAGSVSSAPTNGASSQFGALTASTGGNAAQYAMAGTGGTSGNGYAGGSGFYPGPPNIASGGGGGAGGTGYTAVQGGQRGNGGIGITSSFMNAIGLATSLGQTVSGSTYFGGGGGGGSTGFGTNGGWGAGPNEFGLGGNGGGGNGGGGSNPRSGYPGLALSGGGGGGGTWDNSNGSSFYGGNGGSGVVIIRYPK